MENWWEFGEYNGYDGSSLSLYRLECAFCSERGNWELIHRSEKKKPNSSKKLYFDTYKCGNCSSFSLVFWSGSRDLHNYRVIPYPIKYNQAPEYLPEAIGRYWLQAHRNIRDGNWDSVAVMARSALQIALREKGAQGNSLRDEINCLASRGELPPLMKEWADKVRLLGNDGAHPNLNSEGVSSVDAQDVTSFLDFLLEYLYELPLKIEKYRNRRV